MQSLRQVRGCLVTAEKKKKVQGLEKKKEYENKIY